MEVISVIFSAIAGIIIGLLMITFADRLAGIIGSIAGNSIIRDTNNPYTYKIIGGILIIFSVVSLFL